MRRRQRRSLAHRALAASMILTAIGSTRTAWSEPGDIFSIAAPAIGTAPPKAADIVTGDASVSTQTGALTYSYPVRVPPGRQGMQPGLALAYSSQAAIYGTLAAGWTLSGVPIITEDTTKGRLGVWVFALSGDGIGGVIAGAAQAA